jgi:hypothetical protein
VTKLPLVLPCIGCFLKQLLHPLPVYLGQLCGSTQVLYRQSGAVVKRCHGVPAGFLRAPDRLISPPFDFTLSCLAGLSRQQKNKIPDESIHENALPAARS